MAVAVFAEVAHVRSHSLVADVHGVVVVLMVRVLPLPACIHTTCMFSCM